jgi:predicted RNA-binding protein with PUA-like domain
MKYWLVKSEPDVFSVDDLANCPDQTRWWKRTRNYQARNYLRDEMSVGDPVFFYHSNTDVPGIVGVAEVASEPYPDPEIFNPESKYFDPKSTADAPRWYLVDIRLVKRLDETISLRDIKAHAAELGDFPLIRRGNRLSVMPVEQQQWDYILSLPQAA